MEEHDLYLKPEKCQFKKDEIEYLRVIVRKGHLQMSPKKLQGIADWSPPKNLIEVHSFLGFTGYYRYFIPNYSKTTQPLLDLTKKTTPWHWGEAQHKAFEELKTQMCGSSVLIQPNVDKHSHSTWMPQLMVWVPYSCKRETILQKSSLNDTNQSCIQLHIIQLPSHLQNETMTSMKANYWLS